MALFMESITVVPCGGVAGLDPAASGFAHGFGLFETMKLAEGRLCFWEAHWARLTRSAQALGLAVDCEADTVLQMIRKLVRDENMRDGAVKLSLLQEGEAPRFFAYARPAVPPPQSGVRLLLGWDFPLNERSLLAGHKTHNYMENMLLLRACRAEGYFDRIRLNTAGALVETTIANLFFILGGRLCTPALETGILPGVIRSEVLVSAEAAAMELEEGVFPAECLNEAEALFVTNSILGILPVDCVVGMQGVLSIASGVHPMVKELKRAIASAERRNATDCST